MFIKVLHIVFSVALLVVPWFCFHMAHRAERKELSNQLGKLLEENAGLKRLLQPREQSALTPYREPSQIVCRLDETHPDDCREQIEILRRHKTSLEIQLATAHENYNDAVDVLYGRKLKPLHSITGEPLVKKLPPVPTRHPGPGRLVRG